MNKRDLSADLIGPWLCAHPDYFDEHPEVLAQLRLAHPQKGKTVSLIERQIEVLRDKLAALEGKLADLIRIGQDNERIAERLYRLTGELLGQTDPARLPRILEQGVRDIFQVPQFALQIWHVQDAYADLPCVRSADPQLSAYADALIKPYCGPNSGAHQAMAGAWLGGGAQSIAVVALRAGADPAPRCYGVLALGSNDPQRFGADMGTAFLNRLALLSGAALGRLTNAG